MSTHSDVEMPVNAPVAAYLYLATPPNFFPSSHLGHPHRGRSRFVRFHQDPTPVKQGRVTNPVGVDDTSFRHDLDYGRLTALGRRWETLLTSVSSARPSLRSLCRQQRWVPNPGNTVPTPIEPAMPTHGEMIPTLKDRLRRDQDWIIWSHEMIGLFRLAGVYRVMRPCVSAWAPDPEFQSADINWEDDTPRTRKLVLANMIILGSTARELKDELYDPITCVFLPNPRKLWRVLADHCGFAKDSDYESDSSYDMDSDPEVEHSKIQKRTEGLNKLFFG